MPLNSLASLWVSLNSVSSFFILILVIYCSVTKHSKLSCINNNHLTLSDSVDQELGQCLGMACLCASAVGHTDSDSAGSDSNDCRLELSGDFFIHPSGTWVGMTPRLGSSGTIH